MFLGRFTRAVKSKWLIAFSLLCAIGSAGADASAKRVAAVQCLTDKHVWAAGRNGDFSQTLLDAALARLRAPQGGQQPLEKVVPHPVLFTIEYADGLHWHVLTLNGKVAEWAGAWKYKDDAAVHATLFPTQEARPFAHFGYLVQAIAQQRKENTEATSTRSPAGSRLTIAATAYAIPKETTNQGSGYFSIVCGHNGRLYIGTAKYGENAYLVEFDPATGQMRVVVDAHRAIGTTATGFAAQAKIHTRNNVGASGKIYFGTKQGYPQKGEKRTDYPGGYPMVFDPATEKTRVYPIPVPHHGVISVTPDESRSVAYVSTCSDERPSHFLVLDLATGKYRDLGDCRHMFAFIVVDHQGRAYHPVLGGEIARYDPRTKRLERLRQTIDGQPPPADSLLAAKESHPINWDISPDRKTLYAVAMSGNQLYGYDLTHAGDTQSGTGLASGTLSGRRLGELLAERVKTDCRAMCVGPSGHVWAAVWGVDPKTNQGALHLVSYRPGDTAPRDHGAIHLENPEYTKFTDASGKPLAHHHGFNKTGDGKLVPLYHMGITQAGDGSVYVTVIYPYTVLRFSPERLK